MSTPHYAWYSYVNRITDSSTKHRSKKELAAVSAALEAADQETLELVNLVYITRSKDIRGAADAVHISYITAKRRFKTFRESVARNLGLLED